MASPYARKLAREAGVDVADASGTGPDGRIVAADVQQLISSGAHGVEQQQAFAFETASTQVKALNWVAWLAGDKNGGKVKGCAQQGFWQCPASNTFLLWPLTTVC